MRSLVFFVILLLTAVHVNASTTEAIVKESKAILTIKGIDRVDFEVFKTVKILSEKGGYHSRLSFSEDGSRRTAVYSVIVKDAEGSVVAQYDKKDFKQTSVITSADTYDDVIRFDLDCGLKTFPYTVETYSLMQQRSFFGKSYDLSESEGTSLLQSSFEVIFPKDYKFKYDCYRQDLVVVDSISQTNTNVLKFELKEAYAASSEYYKSYSDRPYVFITPEIFEYGKITGSFNSWEDYGKWISQLWEGRSELTKASMVAIDHLIAENPDKTDLAKAIYNFTQNNMRYVAILLDLGGLQTMTAKETGKLGYGDCKALTNYTAASMNYAGIDAYPAFVYGGKSHWPIEPNNPKFSFNHVILCLPANGDTTWLECTSNTTPYGYLSDFTDDRYVMIMKPTGGELARTPAYSASANVAVRKVNGKLDANGSALIDLSCDYKKLAMNKSSFYYREFSGDKPVNAVKREVNLPSFDLESYSAELYKGQEPALDVNCTLIARNVGRKVGGKLLIKPFLMRTSIPVLDSDSVRIHPVYFKHGYTYTDSISIALPPEMKMIESLKELDESTKFGEISLSSTLDEKQGTIKIVRTILLNSGEYAPDEYPELTSFLDQVRASEDFFIILQ